MIREIELCPTAPPTACADILCAVYNNELWQCRWEKDTAVAYLMDFFHMSKFVGYVVEDGGELIGGLFAHEKVWWNNSEVFIEEMFIRPDAQRKGYGSLLMAQVEAYVKANGRFPVIDTIENEDGDKVIITCDGKGYIIRYTFSE